MKVLDFKIMVLQNKNVRTSRADLISYSYRAMVHIRYFINGIPGAQYDSLPLRYAAKLFFR